MEGLDKHEKNDETAIGKVMHTTEKPVNDGAAKWVITKGITTSNKQG